jgi:hypothetical protein
VLVGREDDELAKAQANLVGVVPEGIHGGVADKVVGVPARRTLAPLEPGVS